jgi:hypothetical protein
MAVGDSRPFMKKIPTLFDRDWDGDRSRVVNVPHKNCGWVIAGEGVATRKIDGTSCMVRDGQLFKRRELRKGDARRHAPTTPVTSVDKIASQAIDNRFNLWGVDGLASGGRAGYPGSGGNATSTSTTTSVSKVRPTNLSACCGSFMTRVGRT